MGYYAYSRRQGVDNSIWAWIAGVGLFLIAIGLIINAFAAAQLRDLQARIADLEVRRVSLLAQQPLAEEEVVQNAHEYAQHWSEGFIADLSNSRNSLQDGGSVQLLQWDAQTALDKKDLELAENTWERADTILTTSKQLIVQILGPPTYFEQLKQKSDAVNNGYLDEVQKTIATKRDYVAAMPQKQLCGSTNTLSYASAVSLLDQAQIHLETVARKTAITVLPEGLIDRPLAFDQAQYAENLAISAAATADQLSSQAETATLEIASCDANIASAALELFGAYDYVSAQSYYDQAVIARTNAVYSCTMQDFASVTTFVSACITNTSLSYNAAQPPPPTPVPSTNDDSNWPSPPGFDNNSSDDWPSPSDDWSSPSDDWGSDDDWGGGSDDWGSDDGWDSGSDDWGSDDGW